MKRWQSSRDENPQEAGLHAHQERYEIVPDENKNDDGQDGWVMDRDVKVTRPIGGGAIGIVAEPLNETPNWVDPESANYITNKISAGMDPQITDQREMLMHQDGMRLRKGDDYSGLSAKELASGFAYRPMSPADDNKTDSEFYGTVKGKDDGKNSVKGFRQRKTVLDRL